MCHAKRENIDTWLERGCVEKTNKELTEGAKLQK
jgi:hypothetical protein